VKKPKVMIVGLGSLGGVLLELLARDEAIGEIVVASRNRARGEARCNLARVGALAQGADPRIAFVPLDLDDRTRCAETIARHSPDLIACTASLQTWWLTELLPSEARQQLSRAPFGAWLPVHLTLAIKFMEAVRQADYRGHTLVASFPDVVNVVLGRLGLAPTCGFGNLDEIVPKVRYLAAQRLHVSSREVRVLLVAHHALEPLIFGDGVAPTDPRIPPYWLRIESAGEDVTADVDAPTLLFERYPLPSGPAWHFLTAGSAIRLVRALLGAAEKTVHVPAPAGLPGGYPVMASRAGVRLIDLPGLSQEQAIAINERSQPFDGIERIEADGTVRFTAQTIEVLEQVLGYNGRQLRPSESGERARELMARFREYAARHGVDLAAAEAASRVMI
jgi:NAD(P)-dependent dehydrogenase (short-subunit alcohol dehydrogenase family)